jgi:hypothetical protein
MARIFSTAGPGTSGTDMASSQDKEHGGYARAARRRAAHMDQAAVAGHDVVDSRQSESCALAGLRGEKASNR